MQLREMLNELRVSRLDDAVPKYLWSDDQLIGFLNDAVRQVCLRQRCLTESQKTSICQIPIAATQQLVKLHECILAVRSVRYIDPTATSTCEPLTGRTAKALWKEHPRWDMEDPGRPEHWVPDYQENMLAISRAPENAGYLKLLVWRKPLKEELLVKTCMDGVPVINDHWHLDLLDWAEHRAFSVPDSELKNDERASAAEEKFTAKIGRLPSATEIRLWGVSPARSSRRAQFL